MCNHKESEKVVKGKYEKIVCKKCKIVLNSKLKGSDK